MSIALSFGRAKKDAEGKLIEKPTLSTDVTDVADEQEQEEGEKHDSHLRLV